MLSQVGCGLEAALTYIHWRIVPVFVMATLIKTTERNSNRRGSNVIYMCARVQMHTLNVHVKLHFDVQADVVAATPPIWYMDNGSGSNICIPAFGAHIILDNNEQTLVNSSLVNPILYHLPGSIHRYYLLPEDVDIYGNGARNNGFPDHSYTNG